MPRTRDLFEDARLVEETRLHLSVILDGRYSEQFFVCFFEIVKREIYLGYYTFGNKHIKLKGIIDFIHSKHYGFGLHGLDRFMLAMADVLAYDETENQYARQLLKWLKKQSPAFRLPMKVHEFERLLFWVRYRQKKDKITEKEKRLFIQLYNLHPEILSEIGEGRQYRTFEQAAIACGILKAVKKKTISLNEDMTSAELRSAARHLHSVLGGVRSCKLMKYLIEIQENERNSGSPEISGESSTVFGSPEEEEIEFCS